MQWLILQGIKVDSASQHEDIVSACMGLENLKQLQRTDRLDEISSSISRLAESTIITKSDLSQLNLPRKLSLNNIKVPPFVRRFKYDLTSIVPSLFRFGVGFTSTILKRGVRLCDSAYVLQVQVYCYKEGCWFVKFHVGASFCAWSYVCVVELSTAQGLVRNACCCSSGYVPVHFSACKLSHTCICGHRRKNCSHVAAGLQLLCDWNDKGDEMHLVSVL